MRTLLTLTLLALCSGIAARADIFYYYTGQNFTSGNTSGSISGYIKLASPFGDNLNYAGFSPTAFSFTDGTETVTNTNNTVVFANWQMSTDASGNPTDWIIFLEAGPAGSGEYTWLLNIYNNPGGAYQVGDGSSGEYTLSGHFFDNSNSVAGSFSTTPPGPSTVPEPSSIALLLTALGGVWWLLVAQRSRVRL
jgi:hypothetical protein